MFTFLSSDASNRYKSSSQFWGAECMCLNVACTKIYCIQPLEKALLRAMLVWSKSGKDCFSAKGSK